MDIPEWPKTVGKHGEGKLPDGSIMRFEVIDEIRRQQSTNPEKILYFQKLQFEDDRIEFRLCYYIIGKKPARKGEWVFGQFATMIPPEDFQGIVQDASAKGWLE